MNGTKGVGTGGCRDCTCEIFEIDPERTKHAVGRGAGKPAKKKSDLKKLLADPHGKKRRAERCACLHSETKHQWIGERQTGACTAPLGGHLTCPCRSFAPIGTTQKKSKPKETLQERVNRIMAEPLGRDVTDDDLPSEHLKRLGLTPKEKSVKTYKIHPAAELFPMLPKAELEALAADIAANGQHDPIIVTAAGLVLDGRNRLAACKIAQVEPEVLTWDREDDGISPTAWVISKNLHRRHLNPGQISVVGVDALPLFEAEAKARQKAGQAKGGQASKMSAPGRTTPPPEEKARAKPVTAAAAAAKAMGVGARTIERAKAVIAKAPKAEIEKIRSGEKTLKQVERETKKAAQVAQVKVYQPPAGAFAVISADPAWPFEDQLDGSDAARAGLPYPSETIESICQLKVPAADDCALWLWCTNTHLINGSVARVLEAWGFTGKTILTWDKMRMGAGRWLRNSTEHCVLAVKGKPVVLGEGTPTLLQAPRGEHSAKPDAFYKLVEKICPSPSRLEMHARAPREGWVTTGSELPPKREGWVEQAEAKVEAAVVEHLIDAESPKAALLNWKSANDGTEDLVAIGFGGMLYRIGEPIPGKSKVLYAKADKAFLRGSWPTPQEAKGACETEDERRREYARTGKKPRKPLKIEDVPGEVSA